MANHGRKEFVFTWEIENFSLSPLETGEKLESPTFRAENVSKSDWYIELYPKGRHKTYDSFISCCLGQKQKNKETIYYDLELIGNDGKILRSDKPVKRNFFIYDWGKPEFFSLNELKEEMKNWSEDILTIPCRIFSCSASAPALRSLTKTKLSVDQCCYYWNVKIREPSIPEIDQHIFFSEKFQLPQFQLVISVLTTSDDKIEFEIHREEEITAKPKLVLCKISLLNLKGKEVISQSSKHLFKSDNEENYWKFPSFLSKADLEDKMGDIMKDDTITLKCEISVSNGESLSEVKSILCNHPSSSYAPLNDSNSDLLDDFRKMLTSSKNSDVKFRVQNQVISAHKCVICARSPVFSTMFDQNMIENETGIVDIEDLDFKTLNSLLEFIYTGCVSEMDSDISMKLLVAADKYEISSLTEECSAFLLSKLSVENVCSVYTVADLVNHKRLKSSVLKCIEKNSKVLLNSNFWVDWMDKNVKLANEILFKLARG